MFRYRVITLLVCHCLFVLINQIHHRYCIGGTRWWSLLLSFNAHSNDLCTTARQTADVLSMAVHSTVITWIMEIPRVLISFRRIRET